jgi:hypothetical protein
LPTTFNFAPAVDDNPETGLPHTTDKRTFGDFGGASRDIAT